MKLYTITVNERQARILVAALDIYSRIGIGQFEAAAEVYDVAFRLAVEVKDRIRAGLRIAKEAAGHPANGSFGIHNASVADDFRNAFDLQQVIRNRLAWDRKPEGGVQVDFDEPRQIGTEPLAKITEAS